MTGTQRAAWQDRRPRSVVGSVDHSPKKLRAETPFLCLVEGEGSCTAHVSLKESKVSMLSLRSLKLDLRHLSEKTYLGNKKNNKPGWAGRMIT